MQLSITVDPWLSPKAGNGSALNFSSDSLYWQYSLSLNTLLHGRYLSCFFTIGVVITVVDHCCIIDPCLSLDVNKGKLWYNYSAAVLPDTGMHTIALSCSPFSTHKNEWWDQLLIFTHKFNNTKEPCSYMTHGEEEAQTKEEKRKEPCPLHDTHQAVHFYYIFYILGEGGEIERNNH